MAEDISLCNKKEEKGEEAHLSQWVCCVFLLLLLFFVVVVVCLFVVVVFLIFSETLVYLIQKKKIQ